MGAGTQADGTRGASGAGGGRRGVGVSACGWGKGPNRKRRQFGPADPASSLLETSRAAAAADDDTDDDDSSLAAAAAEGTMPAQ